MSSCHSILVSSYDTKGSKGCCDYYLPAQRTLLKPSPTIARESPDRHVLHGVTMPNTAGQYVFARRVVTRLTMR